MNLVYEDPVAGESRPFDLSAAPVRFGRSREENSIALRCRKDPSNPQSEEDRELSLLISRHHLEIRLQDGRPVAVDLGSKKGTSLGGRRMEPNLPHPLADGDILRIGDVLQFNVVVQSDAVRLVRAESARAIIDPRAARTAADFSRGLETSILVILFTDQVGSTKMADALGDKTFHKIRRARDKIQSDIIGRAGDGRTIKSTGDGLLCVFNAPHVALERAVEVQRAIAAHNQSRPELERVVMRIGLDMGEVAIDREFNFDVFGTHVNRAARVMDKADGGQILMTRAVADTAGAWAASAGHALASVGDVPLKGFADPVPLYRLDYR